MNRRQKKKYWKNHVQIMNTITGKKHTAKIKDILKLMKIADFSREEIEEWFNRN